MKFTALQALWQQRPPRERRLLALAAVVLLAAALWQWGLAPALATWRLAPQRQAELDHTSRQMLQLQAQARQFEAPARLPRPEAVRRLETAARELLGPQAQWRVQGDQLRVTLNAAPADGLAQWLDLAREQAQARPQDARLERITPAPSKAPASPDEAPRWRGELVLRLP